jgi:hypothetical protein
VEKLKVAHQTKTKTKNQRQNQSGTKQNGTNKRKYIYEFYILELFYREKMKSCRVRAQTKAQSSTIQKNLLSFCFLSLSLLFYFILLSLSLWVQLEFLHRFFSPSHPHSPSSFSLYIFPRLSSPSFNFCRTHLRFPSESFPLLFSVSQSFGI